MGKPGAGRARVCPRVARLGGGWGGRMAGLWGTRSGPQGLAFCVGCVGGWAVKTGETGHLFHLFWLAGCRASAARSPTPSQR